MLRLLTAAVLTAALAGCASDPPPRATFAGPPVVTPSASTASPSPTGSAPLAFASALDLAAALNTHGLPCVNPVNVASPTWAKSIVNCGRGAVILATFAGHAQASTEFDRLTGGTAYADVHVHLAVGWNWTVNAEDAHYAQRVASVFGVMYQSTA